MPLGDSAAQHVTQCGKLASIPLPFSLVSRYGALLDHIDQVHGHNVSHVAPRGEPVAWVSDGWCLRRGIFCSGSNFWCRFHLPRCTDGLELHLRVLSPLAGYAGLITHHLLCAAVVLLARVVDVVCRQRVSADW